jgi:hypothetical protein
MKECTKFQKMPGATLNFQVVKGVACNKCNNEELQLLGSTVKMLGVLATWRPGIGYAWINEMTSMIGVYDQNGHVTCWKFLYWYLRDWK